METVHIPAGAYALGWRHTLPAEAQAGVDSFLPRDEYLKGFSLPREVQLEDFEIQTQPVDVEALLGDLDDDELDAIETLETLCDVVDRLLAPSGWRVPTEDELEAALGRALFAWGDTLPEGTPYQPGDFELHRLPTTHGLVMPSDSYRVELVRSAFKMGDGGGAVCGAYPWPVAWLTLSPSARVPEELVDDLFIWLENAAVHPVRL